MSMTMFPMSECELLETVDLGWTYQGSIYVPGTIGLVYYGQHNVRHRYKHIPTDKVFSYVEMIEERTPAEICEEIMASMD